MEPFFQESGLERLPPPAVRFLNLNAVPYPDSRRLRVKIELTPFSQRPQVELILTDPEGNICATASLVEPMNWKLELTLHIRRIQPPPATYLLTSRLSYPELGEIDSRQVEVLLPTPGGS